MEFRRWQLNQLLEVADGCFGLLPLRGLRGQCGSEPFVAKGDSLPDSVVVVSQPGLARARYRAHQMGAVTTACPLVMCWW